MRKSILNEDIENLSLKLALKHQVENAAFLITGASGLIGSLLVKCLLKFSLCSGKGIKVIALLRDPVKAQSIFRGYEGEHLDFIIQDIREKINYKGNIDYIIHCASITSSSSFIEKPIDTIRTAIYGTDNILSFAKEKQVAGMIYVSSLEVYGTPGQEEGIAFIDESNYAYLDPLKVRSSYSEGKRMAENLCIAHFAEKGIPVKIARLTQTFGAGVFYQDQRVFAEFARCAIEGRDIILHTKGETVRSYCYTTDAINAIFYILLRGIDGEAYNVANDRTAVSILEMARMAAKFSEKNIEVKISEDLLDRGYNPVMKLSLVSDKLKRLGWMAEYDLEEMFRRLIWDMRERR